MPPARQPFDDGPTLGELGRNIDALQGEIRIGIADIKAQLTTLPNTYVSKELWVAEKAGLLKAAEDGERRVQALEERARYVTRWIFGAICSPLVGGVVAAITLTRH